MANVNFHERFAPAEATRGQYAPIDTSTLGSYPVSGSRGRYATLNYIIGSEAGALNLALSGGSVILPVSTVNINEPVTVTQNFPDTTTYNSATIQPNSVSAINFSPAITVLEIYNNHPSSPVYVGFNNVILPTLSAQAMPVLSESYYSIERTTSAVYVGNPHSSNTIDVRIVGHRKA